MRSGFLRVQPVIEEHFAAALELIDGLSRIPLRTLDALHLSIARGVGADEVATADRIVARAARAIGLRATRFF